MSPFLFVCVSLAFHGAEQWKQDSFWLMQARPSKPMVSHQAASEPRKQTHHNSVGRFSQRGVTIRDKITRRCAIATGFVFIHVVNVIYTVSRTHATDFSFNSSQMRKKQLLRTTTKKKTRRLRKMSSRFWTLRNIQVIFFICIITFSLQFVFQLFLNKAS